MSYIYIPKYVDEIIDYAAGETVKHVDYNRNLNILNIAVANNTEALKNILNNGSASVLTATTLNGAQLKRHREQILQDSDEQVPSSKAVYEHVKSLKDENTIKFTDIDTTLTNQDTEMFKINKRIQVVNSLIEQQGGRFDEIEEDYTHITDTMRGGATGQVLAKQSSNPLDYTWTNLLPGPKGDPGNDGYTPIKGVDYTDGVDGAAGYTPIKGVDYFDGEDGYTPVKGVDYFDGIDGADGTNGTNGTNGTDGAPGAPGAPGADGADGEDGADGVGIPTGGTAGQLLYKVDGTNYNTAWGSLTNLLDTYILSKHPVGSLEFNVSGTNPSTYLGGTWVAWGTGRVPVGIDTSQTEFDTVEETGGAKTHTLSVAEMPVHSHGYGWTSPNRSSDGSVWDTCGKTGWTGGNAHPTTNAGSGNAHNNLQPYITCYMWKRTA